MPQKRKEKKMFLRFRHFFTHVKGHPNFQPFMRPILPIRLITEASNPEGSVVRPFSYMNISPPKKKWAVSISFFLRHDFFPLPRPAENPKWVGRDLNSKGRARQAVNGNYRTDFS
jgi:phosphoribosyl 1,2-cyclic phosphodiesterase